MKLACSSGQQFMHVALVTDIKNNPVPGHVKDTVDRQCQLHNPEIGGQMAAAVGNGVDQAFTDFMRQACQFLI